MYFLINPFLGVIEAFKNYKAPWAKNAVWLFIIFYGFTMVSPEGMDSSRYMLKLRYLHEQPLSFESFASSIYLTQDTVDLYEPTVTYIISRVTDNGSILFAVFGLIFGYFYSRNIWMLFEHLDIKANLLLYLMIITFAFVIGFWSLTGVRMWTAAHIFFYGTSKYLIKSNKKGLLIAALSILVHFSFILPCIVLGVYLFRRNSLRLFSFYL